MQLSLPLLSISVTVKLVVTNQAFHLRNLSPSGSNYTFNVHVYDVKLAIFGDSQKLLKHFTVFYAALIAPKL